MCLPRGIRYSLVSPLSARITILRIPLTKPANSTVPSISVITACSLGFRASNSSATRGRPPVMSLVFVVSRGILAMMSPANTGDSLTTSRWAPTGIRFWATVVSLSSLMDTRGWSLPSASSMITFRASPVTSSNSSRTVTPSTMSRYTSFPDTPIVHAYHLAVPVQHHEVLVPVLDRAHVVVLHDSGVLGLVLGSLHDPAGRTADVERPHGQLRAGLADRLGGDDAHRFPEP